MSKGGIWNIFKKSTPVATPTGGDEVLFYAPETAKSKPPKKTEHSKSVEQPKPSPKAVEQPLDVTVPTVTEIKRSLSKSSLKAGAINELDDMNHLFAAEAEELSVILTCDVLSAYFFYYLIQTYSIELMV